MSNKYADSLISAAIDVLHEERSKQSLSHERLADAAQVHRTAVSHLENRIRKPSLAVFIKLSAALKLQPSAVLEEAERRIKK